MIFPRFTYIFSFASLLALVSCTTFLVPKELTKQDISEMVNAIDRGGNKENLSSVVYISETRQEDATKPAIAGGNYGVRLYFSSRPCDGGITYVFVRENGKWVQDTFYIIGPARSCP